MPYATINARRTYYEVYGDGETIVLLHHGFGCLLIWKAVFPALVAAGYRVVLYDRRGYGRSEPGEDFKAFYESDRYRPESVAELAALKAALGIGPCHLLGQCEGGVVAVDYAAAYPEQVTSLVTGSTQCFSQVPMHELNQIKFPKSFGELDPALQVKFHDWHGDAAEEAYEQFRLYGGAYGVEYFDLRPRLGAVRCPALVIYPDRSFIFDVEQGVAFYRHLVYGELTVFPNCGHNTYDERPADYIQAVLDFHRRLKDPNPRRSARVSCAA